MKFLLRSLLLTSLCAFSSWSVSPLVVNQTRYVSVMEGEMVNITCCWRPKSPRVAITWFKNQTMLKNGTVTDKEANSCSTFTFPKITQSDSGIYVCQVTVEIPSLMKDKGTGTTITVTDRNDTNENSSTGLASSLPIPAIIPLGVMVPLLIIALICFFSLRRRQGHAARVIYETPHLESETDKHSTSSSRGSSQWCQVPVYDSLDYFERVETKGSDEGFTP